MSLTPAQIVGANVRAEMARRGLTQMQIGSLLQVSQTGVSKRLRGETPFDINELQMVAHHLGVSPAVLMDDAETVSAA